MGMATPCLPHQGDNGNAGVRVVALLMVLLCPLGWEWKIFVFLQYLAFATRNVPMKKRPTTNLRLNLSVTNPMDLFAGNL